MAGPPTLAANARIVEREDLTDSIARFVVRPDGELARVEPGQYLTLGLVIDGRLLQRPYSTATAPGERDALEFLVRRVPGGAFTPHLWKLRAGDRLRIGRPKGMFTRIPGDLRTHLLVATGTGLAPFKAMVEASGREPVRPRTVLVHGVSRLAELAWRDRFERLAAANELDYVPTISRPADPANDGWTGRTGRAESVLDAVWTTAGLEASGTVAYLCGNPSMIAAAREILLGRALADDAIRSEHYWPG
ncbi:MAG TPA: FAD-binding oxidoreductase [Candidatus Limnocylindrales bacterium]|nr:FAD-binding oxidoreductase [Candidatus Limnocylindrales bacterium]